MQKRRQASLVAVRAMDLQVRALRRARAQCPRRRGVQSAVRRSKRAIGNSTQSWKRSLRLLVGHGS